MGRTGASVSLKRPDSDLGGATIDYTEIPSESFELPSGELNLDYSWRLLGDHLESTELRQGCSFGFTFSEPTDTAGVFKVASALQDLISLARGRPLALDALVVRSEGLTREVPNSSRVMTPISVHTARIGSLDAGSTSQRTDFAFNFDDVGRLAGVARWLEVADEHRAAIALLRLSRTQDIPFQELRYLNALMAAEWFDRATEENRVSPKAEYRTRVSRVLEAAPDDERDWLKSLLENANEPRLGDRLERLARGLGADGHQLISDPERWARACSKLRNRLAHRGGATDTGAIAEAIHYLTRSVYFAVTARLLGLADTEGESPRALLGCRDCQWVAQQLEKAVAAIEAIAKY